MGSDRFCQAYLNGVLKFGVLDVKAGKSSPRAVEGRWVGYDTASSSKGHRIYFANKHRVEVERNVTFSKGDLPVVEDLIIEGSLTLG